MMDKTRPRAGGLLGALLFFCLLLPALTHAESALPQSFSAVYTLNKGPLELAEMTRKLYKNKAGNFVYESFSEPVGYARWFTDATLLEKSEWIFHQDRLRPLNYSYDRVGSKKERHVKLRFDWDKMRVTNNINNDPWSMPITEGTLDKLLYHLAVMNDLERGRQNLSYQVADGGSLKTFNFSNLGEEMLKTGMGTLKTIKLKLPGNKRDTLLWCAVDYNYLPVKIMQEEDDTQLTLTVKSISGISPRGAEQTKR